MKRNLEIVRAILIEVESKWDGNSRQLSQESFAHFDFDDVVAHAALLVNGGLLEGVVSGPFPQPVDHVFIIGLSWEGHNWLDAVRDHGAWERAKAALKKQGVAATYELVKWTAIEFTKFEVRKHGFIS